MEKQSVSLARLAAHLGGVASIPFFTAVVTQLGDLFGNEANHENHDGHGDQHSRCGTVASSHEQYSENAIAHSGQKHGNAHGKENTHG